MATVSSMSHQRQKKVVRYGKSTSRSTYSTTHVADFLDDDVPTSAAIASKPSVKETYAVQKRETPMTLVERIETDMGLKTSPIKAGGCDATLDKAVAPVEEKKSTPKTVKTRARKQDAFDVPSSEDEPDTEVPVKRISPSRFRARRALVDDTASQDAQLAPWEKRKAAPKPAGNHSVVATRSNVLSNAQNRPTVGPLVQKAALPVSPPTREIEANVTSAAARLAARRQLAGSKAPPRAKELATAPAASNKRAGTPTECTLSGASKRARRSPTANDLHGDAMMADELPIPSCNMSSAMSVAPSAELDVFDLPDDSCDEVTYAKRAVATSKAPRQNPRRGQLRSSNRSTPRKGLSAPARLTEMLPVDTDSTDAPSRSPSARPSVPSTPRRSATPANGRNTATPPVRLSSSASPAAKGTSTLTPKQTQLWSQLLPSDPVAPSPSALAIKELSLAGKRRTAGIASSLTRTLTKSKSDVPEMHRRRTRLVDRLRAAAPSSDDELYDGDSDEGMGDAEIVEAVASVTDEFVTEDMDKVAVLQSQSQSQSQATETGAKITYARTRTYLPEDNLEDGLMFNLPSETPQRPPTLARAPSKTNAASQKSAFDLEDSDDEGGVTVRTRTIHELRASGRNKRFMGDTEALLGDIADHNISARSRRRSAFMELATKLADKGYVELFVGQGFEHKLLAECCATADDVADFVLASTFALLLTAEPPAHTVASLKDGGIFAWLGKRLPQNVEISKLAKDRRSNMSKATQGTLADFATTMQTQQSLWDQCKPVSMSSRLIALKALDLLVGTMKRHGDRSELLDAEQLQQVMTVHAASATDTSLSISVLESLSTSALALAWPQDVLERLASLLPFLHQSHDITPHTLFLTFRLTLNLTNDNPRNCHAFATAEVVRYLLHAIKGSFDKLEEPALDEQRAIDLDLLVLAMGITINLAEHNEAARQHAVSVAATPTLDALLEIFQQGQKRIEEAESVEESITNVAFGYLAVMLANVCLDADPRACIAAKLPGRNLGMLTAAVDEFVMHHQKVDLLSFEGEEGVEIWSAFTARLKGVLARLKAVADEG
ncbi:hypothetical protein LTR36_009462 [Oleoguttula mirabilis]|uniref:Wings apart-like protein C-terminal domain-containing protein n=1 Tax=Oleoguttula mirabilis TaxID=1507867 RepID=A0AAV9JSS7_9PEZI|nr:hypothetical protein LTR36_009462 [Oleoguttula mirabilis]